MGGFGPRKAVLGHFEKDIVRNHFSLCMSTPRDPTTTTKSHSTHRKLRAYIDGLFFEISELKSIVAGHPRELSRAAITVDYLEKETSEGGRESMNTKIDPARKDSSITWKDLLPGTKVRRKRREKNKKRKYCRWRRHMAEQKRRS